MPAAIPEGHHVGVDLTIQYWMDTRVHVPAPVLVLERPFVSGSTVKRENLTWLGALATFCS
jgi:hypothetical protein